ncbi:MAG: sarcosine oxidase subunit gamma SoxG [Desulfatirhabdiaceae bacterium]|nr:sarcosine oxidase subunit gamma SoxG [Desulfatirhabdiaceae bacterium]
MLNILRLSPVQFGPPRTTETRNNWTVALSYDDEGKGPFLVDLCHKTRWDLQDPGLDGLNPLGLQIPVAPGSCSLKNGTLINRMNRTQAAIWHLDAETPDLPADPGYTEVTESTVFLALFGPRIFSIAEKLTFLDFLDPVKAAPFLLQGPFSHVPCQIVTLEKNADGSGGLLLTCSRGYGHSMVHAIRDAGSEFGLRPAGENRFSAWLKALAG